MSYRPQPGYVNGLETEVTSTTEATIAPGACRDSTNQYDIQNPGLLVADITVSGANGLDTGVEGTNTWYALHVIDGPSVSPAALFSESATAPALPAGYTVFRRIGWVRNGGGGTFLQGRALGTGRRREFYFNVNLGGRVRLNGGGDAAWTDLSLVPLAPPTCREVQLDAMQSTAGGPSLQIRVNGWTTQLFEVNAPVAGGSVPRMVFYMPCDENQLIEYQNSGGGGTSFIYVVSYVDEI